MFLASSPKPIDPQLRESADKIEQQSPGLSVLAARQFGYSLYQTPVEVTISEPRKFNVLEEFILRAGIEFVPPPTVDELASILGLDRVFVRNTAITLRDLQTIAWVPGGAIALTPQGQQFYEQGSVPQPPQTKQIYAIADPVVGNLFFLSSALESAKVELPELEDFVAIADRIPDSSVFLTIEELQQLVQASGLGLHVPEDGKILTSFGKTGETETIWQPISIFVIFDALEDEVRLQVKRGKKILDSASHWLDTLQAEGKVSLNNLCQLSDETIAAIRDKKNLEVEARIETIQQIALETLRQSRDSGKVSDETGGVVLLRDSQIRKAFLDTLKSASHNVLIYSPWVSKEVVDDEFIRLLQNLANRGVWVLIGYGMSRRQSDEERPIPPEVEQKFREVKTPEGLPAVQIFWLGNSHAKEVVVDEKIHLCGSHNWLSYRGDRLPRGETVYKITIGARVACAQRNRVQEAYEFLANRFQNHAIRNPDSICLWGALGMYEEALNQLQQHNFIELFPLWLKVICQGLRSKQVSPDSAYLKTAQSLLSKIEPENSTIESLRESWRQVIGVLASQNRDTALKLLSDDETWTQFIRLGIAQPPIDSPSKFISKYAVSKKQTPANSQPSQKNTSKKRRGK